MFNDNYICPNKGIPLVTYYKESEKNHIDKIFTPLHYHSDFEILYIKQGKAKMIIDKTEIIAGKGSILLINPYETHYGEIISDSFSYYCIDFNIKLLFLKNETEILNRRIKYVNHLKGEFFEPYVKNILEAYESENPDWELAAKGNLFLLFSLLSGNITVSESGENIFAKKVIDFIEEHFNETISSTDAAKSVGYNHSYFCRTFKKQFRMTFSEYLNIYRTGRAKEFLKNNCVSAAALLSGYSDPSYFTVIFKKITGMTPVMYKKHLGQVT